VLLRLAIIQGTNTPDYFSEHKLIMIRKRQQGSVRRNTARGTRRKLHKAITLKKRISSRSKVIELNYFKDSFLAEEIHTTSFRKCKQGNMKSSECIDGSSQGCLEETVHQISNAELEAVSVENTQSAMEDAADKTSTETECGNCQGYQSELEKLKSVLSSVQNDLENTRKQYQDINKGLETQNTVSDDLKIRLNKHIEEVETLTNQKIEEEIKVIFLESSILGDNTEEMSQKLFFKSSDKIVKQNEMIEESRNRLFEMTKRLTRVENRFLNLKRKSKKDMKLESENSSTPIKKEIGSKPIHESIPTPQGLLVPKPKRLKLERQDQDLGQIMDFKMSTEKDNEITLLKSHIRDMTSRISTFNRCIQNYEELAAEKEVLVKSLHQDLDNKKTELEQFQQSVRGMLDEKNGLKKQILEMNQNLTENSNTIANLRLKIGNFTSNTVDRQITAEKLNLCIGNLNKDNNEKNKKIVLLKEHENMLKLEISKVKEESDMFHEELIKVRKEMDKSRNELDESKKSEKMHSSEIMKLTERCSIFSAEKLKTKEDNDMLQQELNKSKEELIKTCNELRKRQEGEESNVLKLMQISEELERRRNETTNSNRDLTEMKQECANLHKRLSQKDQSEKSFVKEIIQMKQELALNEKSLNITKDVIKLREDQLRKQQSYIEKYIEGALIQRKVVD